MAKKKSTSKKSLKLRKKRLYVMIGCVAILLEIYIFGCVYYRNHFVAKTYMNDINVSGMKVQEVSDMFKEKFSHQTLTLTFIDGQTETLDEESCGLTYNDQNDIQKQMKQQNSLLWFTHYFYRQDIEVTNVLSIDEEKLETALNTLDHLQEDQQEKPVDAKVEYKDKKFQIVEEKFGSTILKDVLLQQVVLAFNEGHTELNVKEAGGYQAPAVSAQDEKLTSLMEIAQKYCQASITYQTISGKVTLDGNTLMSWLSIDESGKYYYDEAEFKKQAQSFVKELAGKINLKGKNLTFKGANGQRTVKCVSYGYTLDQEKELTGLLEDIKNQKQETRTPVMNGIQASYSNGGLGNTFVEIDMTKQHFWMVKNGNVILESDVVTGMANDPNKRTPAGVYYIYFMQRDRVLRGEIQANGKPEYETPVAYWMAFNGGIGLHDATWQSAFGGNLYYTRGSHGCINLPLSVAASLYDMVSVNVPVVCYY